MNRFFIIRPCHDQAVSYLYSWCEELLHFARSHNVLYSDFQKEKANNAEVTKFLAKQCPKLIMFNGHGNPTTIAGHKNQPLVKMNDNEHLLTNAITYAVACDAAVELGRKVAQQGEETAFIGYEGPFGFVHQPSRECTPAKDKFAVPFKQISNEIIFSLLKESTAQETYHKSQQLCSKLLKKYSLSEADKENETIRFWLFWDKHFQKVLGNKETTFP